MARNFRSRIPSVVRSQKRLTDWAFISPFLTTQVGAGGVLIASLNAAALALRPFTIVRSIFELMVVSDQETVSEIQIGGFGVAVVSDQAVGIGVTAIPTPLTDLGSDLWLAHQVLLGNFIGTGNSDTESANRYVVDSKAMRKVNGDQDVVIVTEMNSALASGLTIFGAGRMLFKLH